MMIRSKTRPPKQRGGRSGQALVEFAIISFVLSAIVAGLLGIMVLALGSFQNNIATENAGRVLDQHPVFTKENFVSVFELDATPSFDDDSDLGDLSAKEVYRFLNEYAYDSADPNRRLYDESRLIISRSDWDNRANLGLSAINESLLGQYIFDPELDAYRFPGAVVTNLAGRQTVLIPLIPRTDTDDDDGSVTPHGIDRSFHVSSDNETEFYPVSNDWVAPVVIGRSPQDDGAQFRVILFHPSQPASMIQIRANLDDSGRPDRDAEGFYQYPVEADDDATDTLIGDPPSDYSLAPPPDTFAGTASPYGGDFGLGESFAYLKTVRPYRAVFETSSLFRMGASPITVKYEYEEDGDPGPELSDATHQALKFEQRVIDRSSVELRRYVINTSAPNDFITHFLQLGPNDGGVWRISVSAEFERDGTVGANPGNHLLELRLYKNGIFERVIARFDEPFDPDETILLRDEVLSTCVADDALQVRVLTQRQNNPEYNVRLTGASQTNWLSFERVEN